MIRVYQAEYIKLRRMFLLIVNTFIDDEKYQSKFIKMVEKLDEDIDRKRLLKYENLTYKMKKTEKIRFERYNRENNILDFS